MVAVIKARKKVCIILMYAFSMYSIQPLYAAIFCSQAYFYLVFTPVIEQRDIAGQNILHIGEI